MVLETDILSSYGMKFVGSRTLKVNEYLKHLCVQEFGKFDNDIYTTRN